MAAGKYVFDSDDVLPQTYQSGYESISNPFPPPPPAPPLPLPTTIKKVERKEPMATRSLIDDDTQKESYYVKMISTIETAMKKYSDKVLVTLDGMNGRFGSLESFCRNLEQNVDELHTDLTRDRNEEDLKFASLAKQLQELHKSVQIFRDKQELAETQKELTKLIPVQNEYPDSKNKESKIEDVAATVRPASSSSNSGVDNLVPQNPKMIAQALPHIPQATLSNPTPPPLSGQNQPLTQSPVLHETQLALPYVLVNNSSIFRTQPYSSQQFPPPKDQPHNPPTSIPPQYSQFSYTHVSQPLTSSVNQHSQIQPHSQPGGSLPYQLQHPHWSSQNPPQLSQPQERESRLQPQAAPHYMLQHRQQPQLPSSQMPQQPFSQPQERVISRQETPNPQSQAAQYYPHHNQQPSSQGHQQPSSQIQERVEIREQTQLTPSQAATYYLQHHQQPHRQPSSQNLQQRFSQPQERVENRQQAPQPPPPYYLPQSLTQQQPAELSFHQSAAAQSASQYAGSSPTRPGSSYGGNGNQGAGMVSYQLQPQQMMLPPSNQTVSNQGPRLPAPYRQDASSSYVYDTRNNYYTR